MHVRGFVGSCLILLGGLGTAVLPESTPLMQWRALPAVRDSHLGSVVATVLLLGGVALLAWQWVVLLRTVARVGAGDPDSVESRAALALVRQCTLLWTLPLVLAPPLFSRDGWSYAAQGMLARLGISPYEHGTALLTGPIVEAVDSRWMDSITPYGPLPVFFGEICAGITSSPWILVIAHRFLALSGLVMLAWAVPRLARWGGVNPALASAIVLASPLMMFSGVGGLHNDLLMVGLMACALVVAVERGWIYGAFLGGLAAAVKAPGGVVCIGIVLISLPVAATLKQRLGRLVGAGAIAVGTLLGLGLVTGVGHGWARALTVPGSVATPLSASTVVGDILDDVSHFFGLDAPSHTFMDLFHTLGTLGSGVALVWLALTWRSGERVAALQATALAVGATVALSPVVHPWYLLWLPPFVACLDLGRLVRAALVLGSLVLGCNATLDAFLHRTYFGIALGCLTLGAAVLAWWFTESGRRRLRQLSDSPWLGDDGLPTLEPLDSPLDRPAALTAAFRRPPAGR